MRAVIALSALLFVLPVSSSLLAEPATEVFERASPSVVTVEAVNFQGTPMARGSGVVVATGKVVTNAHVIEAADEIRVRHGGRNYPAKLEFTDWDRDLCQLTVAGLKAPAAGIGSTKRLKTGGRVYAIGAPRGLELTLSEGIISSLRPLDGGQYIQTTAPISQGSSGGGLFDTSGRLIGITSFYVAEGQNLNFAVPVEWVGELPKRNRGTRAPSGKTSLEWLNETVHLQSRGDWASMTRHTQAWVKAEPRSSAAWFGAGVAYAMADQHAKAIGAFQEAVRIDPNHADAWANLGCAYTEPAKAIEALQQAIRIDPNHADAWYNLGRVYSESPQLAKAIEAYKLAIRIDPDHADAWCGLGATYGRLNLRAKAIEALQQAIRVDPNHANAWYNLAGVYAVADQHAKALEAYKQAIRIDPNDSYAWFNLGVAYSRLNERAKVMEVYRTLKTLDTDRAEEFFKAAVLP